MRRAHTHVADALPTFPAGTACSPCGACAQTVCPISMTATNLHTLTFPASRQESVAAAGRAHLAVRCRIAQVSKYSVTDTHHHSSILAYCVLTPWLGDVGLCYARSLSQRCQRCCLPSRSHRLRRPWNSIVMCHSSQCSCAPCTVLSSRIHVLYCRTDCSHLLLCFSCTPSSFIPLRRSTVQLVCTPMFCDHMRATRSHSHMHARARRSHARRKVVVLLSPFHSRSSLMAFSRSFTLSSRVHSRSHVLAFTHVLSLHSHLSQSLQPTGSHRPTDTCRVALLLCSHGLSCAQLSLYVARQQLLAFRWDNSWSFHFQRLHSKHFNTHNHTCVLTLVLTLTRCAARGFFDLHGASI